MRYKINNEKFEQLTPAGKEQLQLLYELHQKLPLRDNNLIELYLLTVFPLPKKKDNEKEYQIRTTQRCRKKKQLWELIKCFDLVE